MSDISDLGVTVDAKLMSAPHLSNIVSRANRTLGLLIRSFQAGIGTTRYYHRSAILAAYFANVRSVLEYCIVVWAEAANSHTVRVNRVQHKFLIWLLADSSSGYANSLSYDDLLHPTTSECHHSHLPVCNMISSSYETLFEEKWTVRHCSNLFLYL